MVDPVADGVVDPVAPPVASSGVHSDSSVAVLQANEAVYWALASSAHSGHPRLVNKDTAASWQAAEAETASWHSGLKNIRSVKKSSGDVQVPVTGRQNGVVVSSKNDLQVVGASACTQRLAHGRLAATEGHEVLLLRLKQARHPHRSAERLSASTAQPMQLQASCCALLCCCCCNTAKAGMSWKHPA